MKYNLILLYFIITFFSACTATTQIKQDSLEQIKEDEEKKLHLQKIEATNEKVEEVKKNITLLEKRIELVEKELNPKVVVKEKIKTVFVEKPVTKDKKTIVGIYEKVYIPSIEQVYEAKIDTGATTTSIHALDIKEFERDGKKWVKFKFQNEKKELIEKSLPVERVVSIKRHGVEKNQRRYVVKMRINLGDYSEVIDVSLTDRSKFNYPILIGRNFLNGYIVVDVSKKYITKPTKK
ncbi:ATP-dependent Zn protease [Halarcobacter mediterraneus]|uniref:ATP-dependent Zn protease n=1 Tax=Halarcobacter mediterraneus TaxID=2023153 RepID=A0A4Q1ATU7_9BACT|nr:ATP-dependent zinc protease [Halarcobacter mediterraneus]RXK12163.1 ATP-dependent Zn protease [Halarcobacter mediterraneus]